MGLKGRTGMLFFGALLTGGLAVAGIINILDKGSQSLSDLRPRWGSQSPASEPVAEIENSEIPVAPGTPIKTPEAPVAAKTDGPSATVEPEGREEAAPSRNTERPRLFVFEPSRSGRMASLPRASLSPTAAEAPGNAASTGTIQGLTMSGGAFPASPQAAPSQPPRPINSTASSSSPRGSSNTIAVAPVEKPVPAPVNQTNASPSPNTPQEIAIIPIDQKAKPGPEPRFVAEPEPKSEVKQSRPVEIAKRSEGDPQSTQKISLPLTVAPPPPPPPGKQEVKAMVMQVKKQEAPAPASVDPVIAALPNQLLAKIEGGTFGSITDPTAMNPDGVVKPKTADEEYSADREVALNEPLRLVPSSMDALECGQTLRPDLVGEIVGVVSPQLDELRSYKLLFADLGPAAQEISCDAELSGLVSGTEWVELGKNNLWKAKLSIREGHAIAVFLAQNIDLSATAFQGEMDMKRLAAQPGLTYLVTVRHGKYEEPAKGTIPKPKK